MDRDKDWNEAFNFSSDLTFVTSCMKETNGGRRSAGTSFWQAFVICALTILTSSQAILIYWSKQSTTSPKDPTQDEKLAKYKYSVTTSNFLVSTFEQSILLQ
ncbi:ABC transporter G family member 28-like protein [Carex littledalei]|uniref:ABC transporter G family member 28-like protein n=1 Tax=Carex littledalei TaxID=544730 RepID=A0A833W285_9POAL|nr:ABC transporter G family member 28-like protein [Carex littledalei]